MKFPSLSIENSNIPKTNCLPITRRRKEKRTIYFHLRFDVSLNDAIDPTGERGGERDPWIPGVAVARRGATGSEPILLWPARWRDSKGRWATNANRWPCESYGKGNRAAIEMIRYSRHGARTFLPSQAFHKMYTFARRQSKAAPLAGTARPKIGGNCAPTAHKFRAGPKVVPVRGGISWMNLVDETGDLERERMVEEIVVTGNFKNCSSYGIVNFLSLESRISEF